jgi:hypothetical protein
MRREILLKVKVGHDDTLGRGQELTKLIVEDNLTTVVGVLETLFGDILVDELGHLRAGDELTIGKSDKLLQLRCNFLLAIESVVFGTLLRLLTIRILLGVLNLTNELGQVLHVVTKGSNFGLDVFEGHYIFLSPLIFKSMRKMKHRHMKILTM